MWTIAELKEAPMWAPEWLLCWQKICGYDTIILYILCLRCRLQIILEDCSIKLIYLSLLWYYCVFGMYRLSGYMSFTSSDYTHLACSYALNVVACLLCNSCALTLKSPAALQRFAPSQFVTFVRIKVQSAWSFTVSVVDIE